MKSVMVSALLLGHIASADLNCPAAVEIAVLGQAKKTLGIACSVTSSKGKVAGPLLVSWAVDMSCGGKTVEADAITKSTSSSTCQIVNVEVHVPKQREIGCDLSEEKEVAINELRHSGIKFRAARNEIAKILRNNKCVTSAIRSDSDLSVYELAEELLDHKNAKQQVDKIVNTYLNQALPK